MLKVFSHYIPASLVFLIGIEAVIFYVSLYLGVELRFFNTVDKQAAIALLEPLDLKALLFTILMVLSMTAMGLHTRNVVDGNFSMLIRIILSFIGGLCVIVISFYIYPQAFLGRGAFALALLVSFISVLFVRISFKRFDNNQLFKRRLLVMGTGVKAELLFKKKEDAGRGGYEVVGFVKVDKGEELINQEDILDVQSTLLDLCLDYEIDEIVLAMDDRRVGFPLTDLLECKMKGIVVRDLLDTLERITGHIELSALHPSSVIFSEGFTKAVSINYVKRVFDILASFLILFIASPIILLTIFAIWLSSFGRDPIFYSQIRLGLCDAPFGVLKFRSMRVDAEKAGAQFAQKNDSRVTKIGKFIRKTRIDELPQLFNVFKGDMSFIGPRPERPQFVLGFEQRIPHYSLRHTVKPGITGWAQICYPYGETEEDTKKKLQFDLYYIKNYSLFLDVTILFQTIQVVLFGQGAR